MGFEWPPGEKLLLIPQGGATHTATWLTPENLCSSLISCVPSRFEELLAKASKSYYLALPTTRCPLCALGHHPFSTGAPRLLMKYLLGGASLKMPGWPSGYNQQNQQLSLICGQ